MQGFYSVFVHFNLPNFFMFTSIKQKALSAGIFGILSLGSLVSTSPTYAAVIDFSTWTTFGDANVTTGQATLTTTGANALLTGGGLNSLEAALDIPIDSLITDPIDLQNSPTQGVAIKNTFSGINSGDVFSFDLNLTGDSRDRAFVSIKNLTTSVTQIFTPIGSSFSYSFLTAGAFDISIGALDVSDYAGQSQSVVSNGNLQPVPEPISVISSIVALGCGASLRKRYAKKA
jgi:hypothetical protein